MNQLCTSYHESSTSSCHVASNPSSSTFSWEHVSPISIVAKLLQTRDSRNIGDAPPDCCTRVNHGPLLADGQSRSHPENHAKDFGHQGARSEDLFFRSDGARVLGVYSRRARTQTLSPLLSVHPCRSPVSPGPRFVYRLSLCCTTAIQRYVCIPTPLIKWETWRPDSAIHECGIQRSFLLVLE